MCGKRIRERDKCNTIIKKRKNENTEDRGKEERWEEERKRSQEERVTQE